MPGKRFITLLLLVSFLAACTLVPQQTSQPGNTSSQSLIQPASYQHQAGQSNQTKTPEKITFPSMVKTTALSEPTVDKHQQLNEMLQELLKQDEQQSSFNISQAKPKRVEIVRFMAKANNPKHQIKTPETGSFKLVLEVGAKHEIVDADATDGEARIRMPAGSFETLLHLPGPWQPSSSLEIEDGLYYVKDTFNNKQGKLLNLNPWHLLGVRPMPVPQDWYSPDGQSFVLQFKAQNVKEFQIAWWRENGEFPFPPGSNRVGPEGGTVQLPGIAEMDIPAGAFLAPTVVKLTQVLQAPFRGIKNLDPNDPITRYRNPIGEEYASPVVRIDPFNTKLLKPAYLKVALLDPTYQVIGPGSVHDLVSENLDETDFGIRNLSGNNGIFTPIRVEEFLFYGKLAEYGWLNRWKGKVNQFKVNQVTGVYHRPVATALFFDHWLEGSVEKRCRNRPNAESGKKAATI